MRRWALLLAALLPAACGGSAQSSSIQAGSTPSIPETTTTQASAPAVAPATTSSTAAATTQTTPQSGGPSRCTAATLTLSGLGQQGAMGHGVLGFALRNTGVHPCRTYGFPGVLFLDRAGAPMPTTPDHVTHDLLGSVPAQKLVLGPGQSASFRLAVTHGLNSTAGCATAYGVQVFPPDDTQTLRVAIPNGAYECRTVTVSPLQPGLTAYP